MEREVEEEVTGRGDPILNGDLGGAVATRADDLGAGERSEVEDEGLGELMMPFSLSTFFLCLLVDEGGGGGGKAGAVGNKRVATGSFFELVVVVAAMLVEAEARLLEWEVVVARRFRPGVFINSDTTGLRARVKGFTVRYSVSTSSSERDQTNKQRDAPIRSF